MEKYRIFTLHFCLCTIKVVYWKCWFFSCQLIVFCTSKMHLQQVVVNLFCSVAHTKILSKSKIHSIMRNNYKVHFPPRTLKSLCSKHSWHYNMIIEYTRKENLFIFFPRSKYTINGTNCKIFLALSLARSSSLSLSVYPFIRIINLLFKILPGNWNSILPLVSMCSTISRKIAPRNCHHSVVCVCIYK